MARTVRTSLFPYLPDHIDEGTEVVALGASIPRERNIVARSLSSVASEILARNGVRIAPKLPARRMLRQAIFRAAPGTDVDSMVSRTRRILDITLKTGIDPALLSSARSARVRQFGSIAAEYRRILRQRSMIDSSEVLLTAAGRTDVKRKLLIYGHFRARPEELEFIDSIAADGSIYYLPVGADPIFDVNRKAAAELVKRGWVVSDEEGGRAADSKGAQAAARFANISRSRPPVRCFAFPDIDKEVRWVLSSVKQLLRSGTPAGEIALIARDLNLYSRPISVAADEYGLPVETDHSIPIGTTGFGGFLAVLIEAIEREFAFEPTARLTMHPFGPGLGDGQIAEARRRRAAGLARWLEFCPQLEMLNERTERPLAEWTAFLLNATDTLGARARAVGLTTEWLAYETLFESLRAAADMEPAKAISFEAFAAIVREILTEDTVKMRPRRGGVTVMRPEDIVGKAFDNVFVLGLAEGVFPRPPKEDPVIDFFERGRLLDEQNVHFASAVELAHWEDLSFYFTLLAAKEQIVLSYPKVIDNAEMVPGAFFERLGIDGGKVSAIQMSDTASSVEEVRRITLRQPVFAFDNVLDLARRNHNVELAREISAHYDEFDGVIGVPIDPSRRSWSASQITMIGQCSFRWFAGRLLRLSAVEEMETGLDPGTRGRLYHKALEIAVSRSLGSPDNRAATLENIDAAFAEAETDETVKLPILPNWEVERREQLAELRKAVQSPMFIMPDAEVLGVEREFRAEWEGFRLRGLIDRIDKAPAGLIAVDYKASGQMPKGAKDPYGKLTVDVQIPLYSRVALPALYPDEAVGTSVYYSLTKRKVLRAEQEGDMERLTALARHLRWILEKGSFAVDPDIQERSCTYCDLKTVCRKGPRLRRKRRAE